MTRRLITQKGSELNGNNVVELYIPYAKMATIDVCYLVKFLQPLMVQHQKEMK